MLFFIFESSCTNWFRRTLVYLYFGGSYRFITRDMLFPRYVQLLKRDYQLCTTAQWLLRSCQYTSQKTSSETNASTSQGMYSCPRQADFHEVIDLSQYSTPSTPVGSVQLSGLQIYKEDVQTVHPKSMITDTIVSFLFK